MNNTLAPDTAGPIARLYTALADSDVTALRASLADDVVLHVPGTHALSGDHHGPEGVLRFVGASRALTDDGEHIEVLDVLAGGTYAAALCRITATRPGRVPLDNHTVHLARLSAGRVAELWLHNRDDFAVNEFWS